MNYADIVNAAYKIADREDSKDAYALKDTFLRLVEARINRNLKLFEMSDRVTITTTADKEYYALPEGFNGIIDLEIRDSLTANVRTTLQYISPEQMNSYSTARSYITPGRIFYTLLANQVQIMPPQDEKVMEMVYHKTLTPLTSTDGNFVADNNPDIYISGLVVEISRFVKDLDSMQFWDSQFTAAVEEAKQNNARLKWSGPSLTIKVG